MAIIQNQNIDILLNPGQIFTQEMETHDIAMDNAQAAHIAITTGEPPDDFEPTVVKVEIYGLNDNGRMLAMEEKVTLTGNCEEIIVVRSRQLAHHEFHSISLKFIPETPTEITACVFAVMTNERYNAG